LEGGKLTIPKEVREKLSRKDEDFVDFYLQDMVQIK
jgi:bifunctional DNA-binding transcriptional regulator/antitoxin component of YhaV-PrlF toxin-antitoxin module